MTLTWLLGAAGLVAIDGSYVPQIVRLFRLRKLQSATSSRAEPSRARNGPRLLGSRGNPVFTVGFFFGAACAWRSSCRSHGFGISRRDRTLSRAALSRPGWRTMSAALAETAREVAGRLETASLPEVLRFALQTYGEQVTIACSLGVEDMVVLHEAARVAGELGVRPRVFLLDTGRLHQETYARRPRT